MRVAFVVPGGVDASGTDRVIPALLWLVERVARRHDVRVFALHQQPLPGTWPLLGAQVHNIGTVGAHRRRLFATFDAEHRRRPFDVVHAVFGGAGTYAALLGWRHRLPVLLHLAGGELARLPDIGYGSRNTARGRAALAVAVAGASTVTVATRYMRDLAASLGIRTAMVPLGVDLDRWPASAPRRRDPARPARLLHIGDLRPVKDQPTLLAAVARLLQDGVAVQLDIAGHDTTGGELQRSAAAARVAHVTCWHGLLRRDALRALVGDADLLLVTSRHEAGPVAVLEAAVAGVPTVGTAVGHVADWSPECAVAVPVGDAEALACEVAALLANEPRRLAIAQAAQRRAVRDDANHTAACVEQLYETLVARAQSGRRMAGVS